MFKKVLIMTLGITLSTTGTARTINVPIADDRAVFTTTLIPKLVQSGNKYSMAKPYATLNSVEHSRIINDMRNKKIDLFWSMTSKEYEDEFRAIYIPVYRGLLGMRIPIIKKTDKNKFKNIKNISDLKQFKAGQGRYWTDTKILKHNFLPVVTEVKYNNLFNMLNASRFDYFPRGIQEPWGELASRPHLDLTVDENILLWYKAPMYIFVRKNDEALAQHITEQFEKIIKDGTFKKMFYHDPDIKKAILQSKLASRNIIHLDVPFENERTPTNRKELWLTPDEIINPALISEVY